MTDKLLLEIIIVLIGALFAVLGWLFVRHDRQHEEVKEDLSELKHQHEVCTASFATKGAMERAHMRIDEQQEELVSLSTRVIRLESCAGKA